MKELANYYQLVGRVDDLCRKIRQDYSEEMVCKKGCAGCCRHISIFPVEAAALSVACNHLSPDLADHIRSNAGRSSPGGGCPLLENSICLLYPARPIICRTHGFPILLNRDDEPKVDYCPLNFKAKEISSFPSGHLIDLEHLNQLLVMINALFLEHCGSPSGLPERLTIAESVRMPVQSFRTVR